MVYQATGVNPLTYGLSHSSWTGTTPDHIRTLGRYSGYSQAALHYITDSFLASNWLYRIICLSLTPLLSWGAQVHTLSPTSAATGLLLPQAQPPEHGSVQNDQPLADNWL